MPTTLPRSLLIQKYEKLPPELREAIASVDTANIILRAGRTHGLTIDKIGKLAEETGYIMGGVSPTKDFIPALEEALEIPYDKAKAIALEINQKVFLPIREHLKNMHGEKWADEIASGAKPPTTKPAAPAPAPVKVPPPAPAPLPRAPEIRPMPQPQPKPETKEVKPQAPVIPPAVKAPLPLPPLAAEPEGGGFVKKPEPLVIGPLGRERREPIEKAFEIKPLPTAAPIQAKAAPPPSEVKPIPVLPSAAAKPEVSLKEIKPFRPLVMKSEEELPIVEKIEGAAIEKEEKEKPPFAPPKPLEYIRSKEDVAKELQEFQKAVDNKITAEVKAEATAGKPIITKEKLMQEIERVKSELTAKEAEEKPVTKLEIAPPRAAEEALPPQTPPTPQPAKAVKPAAPPPSAPTPHQSTPTASSYSADPYREAVE